MLVMKSVLTVMLQVVMDPINTNMLYHSLLETKLLSINITNLRDLFTLEREQRAGVLHLGGQLSVVVRHALLTGDITLFSE